MTEFFDPTNTYEAWVDANCEDEVFDDTEDVEDNGADLTYEAWRDIHAETHEQDEELIREKMSEDAAEWLSDPDNAYDIYMDSLCESEC